MRATEVAALIRKHALESDAALLGSLLKSASRRTGDGLGHAGQRFVPRMNGSWWCQQETEIQAVVCCKERELNLPRRVTAI